MSNSVSNTKILAKNTLLLYFRTIVVMIVTLDMSRLILDTLGVEDYGVYNVVGGTVAMFSVLTGALASSISRFITFELGKENIERLKSIFITSVNVQLLLAISIIFKFTSTSICKKKDRPQFNNLTIPKFFIQFFCCFRTIYSFFIFYRSKVIFTLSSKNCYIIEKLKCIKYK